MSDVVIPPSSVSNLLPAVGFFFGWTTLYFTLCLLNSRRSYEWHVRTVTAMHALLVCAMCGWSGFVLGPWPFTDPGPVMLLHHVLSILGNSIILYWGVSGTEMIATIFGSELTNPFLQARWFLRKTNCHLTWYGELNDATFMLLFLYLRIIVGSSLLYWVMLHPRPHRLVKLGGVLHYLVGWAFLIMIIRYAIKKYIKMYRRSRAKRDGGESVTSTPDTTSLGDVNSQGKPKHLDTDTYNGSSQSSEHNGTLTDSVAGTNGLTQRKMAAN